MLQGERGEGEGENACMYAYRYIYRHMLQWRGGDDRNIYRYREESMLAYTLTDISTERDREAQQA